MATEKWTATDVARAITIAVEKHAWQLDKAGQPYIFHPIRVVFIIRDQYWDFKTQIVAALHDVIEDSGVTREQIIEWFDEEIADAVVALSRIGEHKETYRRYVERLKKNPIARAVKIADLIDNLDEKRLSVLGIEERKMMEKRYRKAAKFLISSDETYPELEV